MKGYLFSLFKPLVSFMLLFYSIAYANTTVTDIAGRTVTIPDKVERILLGEGRLIHAVAILEGENPFGRIVGWQGDFKKLDQQSYNTYKKYFPKIDHIPLIGNTSSDSINSETVLSLMPDIAVFGLTGHGPGTNSELVTLLEKLNIPVVFVDFRTSPLKNTIPSIRLLGKALHREEKAEKYIAFYEAEMKKVTDIIATISDTEKPKVFLEMKAGTSDDCCTTAGNGNMGEFIDIAGGKNIAKPILPTPLGKINLEEVLSQQPDVYIATGSGSLGKNIGIPFGMETPLEMAKTRFNLVLSRTTLSTLEAIKNNKVHAIWHSYYNSPYNIVVIQNFAKWFYPEKFETLSPQETLNQIHTQFLAIPAQGTFWVD